MFRLLAVLLVVGCTGCGGCIKGLEDSHDRRPPDEFLRTAAALHTNQPDEVAFSRYESTTCDQEPTADLKLFCSAKVKRECNAIQHPEVRALCRDNCADIVDPGLRHVCNRRTFSSPNDRETGGSEAKCSKVPTTSKFYSMCMKPDDNSSGLGRPTPLEPQSDPHNDPHHRRK